MKAKLTWFLLVIFLAATAPAHAGFWHAKKAATTRAAATTAIRHPQPVSPTFAELRSILDNARNDHHTKDDSGWQGILSLTLGVIGFFSLITLFVASSFGAFLASFLGIPAFVLGIIGLKKRYKGMALAGLILGAVTTFLLLLILTIVMLVISSL